MKEIAPIHCLVLNFDEIGEVSQEVVQRVYGLSPLQAASMDYFKFNGVTIPIQLETSTLKTSSSAFYDYDLSIALKQYTVIDRGDYVVVTPKVLEI